jgi:hypothetical protein
MQRLHRQGEVYRLPVPANQHFECLEPEIADAADPEPVQTWVDPVDKEPVSTLSRLGEKLADGLAEHGIVTIGDLRSALSDDDRVEELLTSEKIRFGQGLLRQFRSELGLKDS